MYLLNNTVSPMMAKKYSWFEALTGEEQPQSMAGLLLILVLLLHIGGAYLISLAAPTPIAKPEMIMEVTLVAVPLPVADVAPPLPMVEPPKPIIPPKPVPPPPKPIVKPKPVVKPKPKKPVVPKTETIPIPVAKEPSPLPVTKPTPIATPTPPKAAPAVSQSRPAQSAPEKTTQASVGANYASNPKPKYPSVARSRGWEGKVILRVRVSADGDSEGVTVVQSSGHDVLDEAAVNAVEGWRFTPAKRGDTAVASTVNVPINFKLDN
jgi:periplasmic protein TonB